MNKFVDLLFDIFLNVIGFVFGVADIVISEIDNRIIR